MSKFSWKIFFLSVSWLCLFSCDLSGREKGRERENRDRKPAQAAVKPGGRPDPFLGGKPFYPKNRLDRLFLRSLRKHKLEPAPISSDEVFLRRIHLDLLGTVPTVREVREFLEDDRNDKRTRSIDALLARTEFVDFQTMRWCDLLRVKAEFPINLWPNGAACYYRWIRRSVDENKPYDRFVRDLVTANGSNFRDGASNFYRAVPVNDADTLAETVFRTFLGVDVGPWPKGRREQAAVFFSRVGYKETAQWKEEIVFWDRKPLDRDTVVFPDGTTKTIGPNDDPRQLFADWLISPTNDAFNRVAVNRVWTWLFGGGLIPEPEDAGAGQGPIHPELLDALCSELVRAKYDLKQLYRLILDSNLYQQSSIPKGGDPEAVSQFAAYPIRRIEAEVFQDMLARIFDLPVGYVSEVPEPFTRIPPRYRTVSLPDSSITSSFLEMFGRASRDTGTGSDRNTDISESQLLFLLNSTEINTWIVRFAAKHSPRKRPANHKGVVDGIWLTFLSRYPTEAEYRIVVAELQKPDKSIALKIQDLIWCLINSKEFLCKH